MDYNRRIFLKTAATGAAAVTVSPKLVFSAEKSVKVEVVNPRTRIPVSLIIDDSTTLVNMAHFGIPQFAEVFPANYKQDWRKLPREIPDSFVREFGEWSAENGVKGKYSIVPYLACTGWVDRFIPGWTKRELEKSLKLTVMTIEENTVKLKAPFASPDFTLKINATVKNPTVKNSAPLQQVNKISELKSVTFCVGNKETFICFDLKKGETEILI